MPFLQAMSAFPPLMGLLVPLRLDTQKPLYLFSYRYPLCYPLCLLLL